MNDGLKLTDSRVLSAAGLCVAATIAYTWVSGLFGFHAYTDPFPALVAFVIWLNRRRPTQRQFLKRDVASNIFWGVAVAEFILGGVYYWFLYVSAIEILVSPFVAGAFAAFLFLVLDGVFDWKR